MLNFCFFFFLKENESGRFWLVWFWLISVLDFVPVSWLHVIIVHTYKYFNFLWLSCVFFYKILQYTSLVCKILIYQKTKNSFFRLEAEQTYYIIYCKLKIWEKKTSEKKSKDWGSFFFIILFLRVFVFL